MNVAHDVNAIEEERRKEAARLLVRTAARKLYGIRLKGALIESRSSAIWSDIRALAQDLITAAGPLDLGLLVACAREVLHFAESSTPDGGPHPDRAAYMLSALDTLGMELERLKSDRGLR